MKNKIYHLLALSVVISLPTQAEQTAQPEYLHTITAGGAFLSADKGSSDNQIKGLGASYALNHNQSSWGLVVHLEHAKTDHQLATIHVDEEHSYLMAGVSYQPQNYTWLRLYPLLGLSQYQVDATDYSTKESAFAYGVGAQFEIPDSQIVIEVNYKQSSFNDLNLNGDKVDVDASSIYIGAGYQF